MVELLVGGLGPFFVVFMAGDKVDAFSVTHG
jgi:hypothetical protein